MRLSLNVAFSSAVCSRLARRGLLLLLTLSLLAGSAAPQGAPQATVDRLIAEGRQLMNEGSAASLQRAARNFDQLQRIYRAARDVAGEAGALYTLGLIFEKLKDSQKALEYYSQAAPLFRAARNQEYEAASYMQVGSLYRELGETQKALDNLTQAVSVFRAAGSRKGEAITSLDIAMIHSGVGERQKALDLLLQALSIFRSTGDRQGMAIALTLACPLYAGPEERERKTTRDCFNQLLTLSRSIRDRTIEAGALIGIGAVDDYEGERAKALNNYMQAMTIVRATGNRGGEAGLLTFIGFIHLKSNDFQQGFDHLTRALAIYRELGDQSSQPELLGNMAYFERNRGNLSEARARMEEAINIIETLRLKIVNEPLRASYFSTTHDFYDLYIDILMRLHKQRPGDGHDAEALRMSERARARVLLENLAEANADLRQGVDPRLIERERLLQQRLNTQAQKQMNPLNATATPGQANAAAKEMEALVAEFQQVQAQIRQSSPRYASLTQPQPLTPREIQAQLLDSDTLLLEYFLGSERSFVWAVTPDSIKSYELPKREEIEAASRRVYDLLTARNQHVAGETPAQRQARIAQADSKYTEAAADLSHLLLAPVAPQMGTKKRLLIVSDGALQYIPFAALPAPAGTDDSAPLIARHEIVSLPSASTLSALRKETGGRQPAARTLAVLADPVFELDDERVKSGAARAVRNNTQVGSQTAAVGARQLVQEFAESAQGAGGGGKRIPRLPGTREEATQLLALVPAGEGKQALDFAASRTTATSPDLSQYRYVHFATHGFLNSFHPELSGIVLSMVDENGNPQDGFLRANDIFNLKLPAELVVLSACQTGLGKEIKGEGLVGLTRGFMYAGSPRVVVSLWSVSDTGTAELMTRFYRAMLKDKMRPAAALRAAQVSLSKEKRWEQPFYWAAFILQGEWQ